MINVNEFKEYFDSLTNKHQSGAGYSPLEFNKNLHTSMLDVVRQYVGSPERYRHGQPIAEIGNEVTHQATQSIIDLKVSDFVLPVVNGIATLPPNFMYWNTITTSRVYSGSGIGSTKKSSIKPYVIGEDIGECGCEDDRATASISPLEQKVNDLKAASVVDRDNRRPVTMMNDQMFSHSLDSIVAQPSLEYPIAKFSSNSTLTIAPTTVTQIYLTYIKYPNVPKWAYTVNATSLIESYDQAKSIDIELPISMMTSLAMTMAQKLGMYVREGFLKATAEDLKKGIA